MWQAWGEEKYVDGFGGKPEGNSRLGRPKRAWKDNIKVPL
jgi:hypothetical protein